MPSALTVKLRNLAENRGASPTGSMPVVSGPPAWPVHAFFHSCGVQAHHTRVAVQRLVRAGIKAGPEAGLSHV